MRTKPRRASPAQSRGIGIDQYGDPVIDPTQNVKDLSEASSERQDDLRELTKELFEARNTHTRELAELEPRPVGMIRIRPVNNSPNEGCNRSMMRPDATSNAALEEACRRIQKFCNSLT